MRTLRTKLNLVGGARLFSVAQTSESAVSQVSKPAGRSTQKDAYEAPDAQPTWKSAIQQTRRSALRRLAHSLAALVALLTLTGTALRQVAGTIDPAFSPTI